MRNQSYSKIYRTMHWCLALTLILILLTVFLRMTWMNKDHMAAIIENFLTEKGTSNLSKEELIVLAKQIRKPMWDWHIYLGYVFTGLFAVRLLLPTFNLMPFPNPFQKNLSRKEKIQFGIYTTFYLGITISLVTGLLLKFGPKHTKDLIETIHKLSLYYVIPYLIIHVGSVIWAEFTNDSGIVSRIISGKKTK